MSTPTVLAVWALAHLLGTALALALFAGVPREPDDDADTRPGSGRAPWRAT